MARSNNALSSLPRGIPTIGTERAQNAITFILLDLLLQRCHRISLDDFSSWLGCDLYVLAEDAPHSCFGGKLLHQSSFGHCLGSTSLHRLHNHGVRQDWNTKDQARRTRLQVLSLIL